MARKEPTQAAQIADEVLAAREGGPPVLVATVISAPAAGAAPIGAKMLVRADGSRLGRLDGGPLDGAVLAEAPDAFRRHGVETVYVAPGGARLRRLEAAGRDSYQVMLEVHERPATLLVIGGGHVGKALSVIGDLCGFSVAIVDDRPEYANRERFPEAADVVCGRFEEVLRDYPIDAGTYIVCVTRGHKHDEESLRRVVGSPAAYVGMIGSKRRVGAVLQHLVEDGADPQAVARVHTPIGLDIGAETPEEIAVAIMAEIIQARRGGSGRPLRESRKPRPGIAPAERLPEPGE
ncbi:MAG: XdhC/CoxI family protein [Dehalococcoidia bacterium]|nr:XdhC/CoxI family protein [Dehalococcoidia bacterium]